MPGEMGIPGVFSLRRPADLIMVGRGVCPEIDPGEIVFIKIRKAQNPKGLRNSRLKRYAHCNFFEHVYFARPDSGGIGGYGAFSQGRN